VRALSETVRLDKGWAVCGDDLMEMMTARVRKFISMNKLSFFLPMSYGPMLLKDVAGAAAALEEEG